MEDRAGVEAAFSRVLDWFRDHNVAVVDAQVSDGEACPVLWLDVASSDGLLDAVVRIVQTCAVRFVAVAQAPAGDETERSVLLVGDPLIGLRFGTDLDDDLEDSDDYGDLDEVEVEETVASLSAAVLAQVASTTGVEPSNVAKIEKLLAGAIADADVDDERVRRLVSSQIFSMRWQIGVEIKRRHQKKFAHQASQIAEAIVADDSEVLSKPMSTLRLLVHDHLLEVDHECATKAAGEPIVQALKAMAKAPRPGLF